MNDPVLAKVGELLAEIASELEEPTPMVTHAVVVTVYMDDEGDRWLRIIHNNGIKNWEVRGMLSEVLADMDACDVVYQLEGDA